MIPAGRSARNWRRCAVGLPLFLHQFFSTVLRYLTHREPLPAGVAVRASEFVAGKLQSNEYRKCPACGGLMLLTLIEPDKLGYDKRTFECPRCQNELTEVVKNR